MNHNTKNTKDSKEPRQEDCGRHEDEQFWIEWWREYAQTWK